MSDGVRRAPMNIICPDGRPCSGIRVEDFAVWTESGSRALWKCGSAYGIGGVFEGW